MSKSRKTNTAFRELIGQARDPVYVLDQGRTIRYCNQSCADWVGVDVTGLTGRRCDYHSVASPEVDGVAAGLCPNLAAFSGERTAGIVAARSDDGSLRRRRAEFIPLEHMTGTVVLVIVASHDLAPHDVQELAYDEAPCVDSLHEQIREIRSQMSHPFQLDSLVGVTASMRRVRDQIVLAAQTAARTVVTGPPGSGREHIARTIDAMRSSGAKRLLLPLDCSLMDAELIETTIGALRRRTAEHEDEVSPQLLLLEVDQLSDASQFVLNGFVHDKAFEFHTLSTSRESLIEAADEGRFKGDLACALSTLEIRVPALAEHPTDIPLLAQAAIERFNAMGGHQVQGLSPSTAEMFLGYSWSGNVDELFAVIAEAHAASSGTSIEPHHLPQGVFLAADAQRYPARVEEKIELDEYLREIEAELIGRALATSNGNRAEAARILGISRSRLLRRIENLGVGE